MTPQEITDYYTNLLIAQYVNQPNARAFVDAFVSEVVANSVIAQVRDGFDLDTAVGPQLDILGSYHGVGRAVHGLDLSKTYFSLPASGDPDLGTVMGFATGSLGAAAINWYFLRYQDANQPIYFLGDAEYRKLLKFKMAIDSSTFGLGELDDIFFAFFGTYVNIVDNLDMTMTYQHYAIDPDKLFSTLQQTSLLPKPAGVGYTVSTI